MRKKIKESTVRRIIRKELIREAEGKNARLDDKLNIAFNQVNISDKKEENEIAIKIVKQMTHLVLVSINRDKYQQITGEGGRSTIEICKDISESIGMLSDEQKIKVKDSISKVNQVIRQYHDKEIKNKSEE